MKKILLAAGFLTVASFNMFGAACSTLSGQTLANFATAGSCTVTNGSNNWTLSNFVLTSTTMNSYPGLPTSSDVKVSVDLVGGNGFSLTYTKGDGTDFFTSSSQDVSWLNGVWVTGTNVVKIDLSATVASGNAYASVAKEIQNQNGDTLKPTLAVFFNTPGTSSDTTGLTSIGTNLSINDRFVFDSKSGRTGVVTSYSNTFYAQDTSVPEPMTFVLMGAGLVGIAALRRRKA